MDKFEQCDDANLINGDGCSSLCQKEGDNFPVVLYTSADPPPAPSLQELPLLSQVTQHGITWTFSQPQRVGRFVNGDYYVVGTATVVNIDPLPTSANGRHGSMLNIRPNIQRSGFDSRIQSGRYDASLRVYPPITLTPGNRLVSSRSAATNPPAVMRPNDTSVSPVASVSILTSVGAPQPLDAFRPSYAQGSTAVYLSRDLRRHLLPKLPPVQHVPPFSEFEGYLKRPWVDSVFFNFDVPAEYMASYGRENGYLMSFAGLLLTLGVSPGQKEPLLVYLTQYGIDLYGLVEQGHQGWQAHGGHGTGRKFPIVLAGTMLDEEKMKNVRANFGEDMQTIWVSQTPPAGTYTKSWHANPQTVVYGGHVGINGESVNPGWGPYEHLAPSAWKNTLGESYRRCCTSASWVGEALAARLIPGLLESWDHPQFFSYVDRWMLSPDDPRDLEAIRVATGMTVDSDFMQGQSWKILSGGGYYQPHRTFVDEMWAAYRNRPPRGATDIRAYHLPTNQFFEYDSGNLGQYGWGESDSMPLLWDNNRDGNPDISLYHLPTNQWLVKGAPGENLGQYGWGGEDSVPVPGDYDGDGIMKRAFYHTPSNRWFVEGKDPVQFGWGGSESIPLPGDYDGDGKTDLVIYHVPTNQWFMHGQGAMGQFGWGGADCLPVPGDYDGDGKMEIAAYHVPSNQWFVKGHPGENLGQYGWGGWESFPIPGDYDGDGVAERAFYRPADNRWFIEGNPEFRWGWDGPNFMPVTGQASVYNWFRFLLNRFN